MSTSPSHSQGRLSVVPLQGARDVEAHRATGELLSRLAILARGSQKSLTPHSRQEFARELRSEDPEAIEKRHLHVFDLAYALQVLDAEARAWLLEPLLSAAEASTQPVLIEMAEATEATGEALSEVQRLLAAGPCTPRELQQINARFHTAARELRDVPRALGRIV